MTVQDTTSTTRLGILHRLGLFLTAHARMVLVVGLLVLMGAAILGTTAFGKLKSGGFEDPGSQSVRAAAVSNAHFAPEPNLVLVVTAKNGSITGAAEMAAGRQLTTDLAAVGNVSVAGSYFTAAVPGLLSKDGHSAMILLRVGGDQGQAVSRGAEISKEFNGDRGPVSVRIGGSAGIFSDINTNVSSSLAIAESIAIPVTLILLLLVFGSVLAALLPLLIGTFAIVGTFAELAVLAGMTDVSIFAINLTTALGLGLGIDYGLLMVARFREQLRAGDDVPTAVARTVATAGRTILFSAAAVMAALATLTLFPLYFLSSFGYAGVGVVVIAAVAALLVTPAALAVLGHRVDKWKLPFAGTARGSESHFWGTVARTVFKRPMLTALPVLALLLVAASPLLGIHFALPDETVLPESAASRQVATVIDDQFPGRANAVLSVISHQQADSETAREQAIRLASLPGVESVDFGGGSVADGQISAADPTAGVLTADGYQRLKVNTDALAGSERARSIVASARAVIDPAFLVGGADASLADTLAGIGRPLPIALAIIVITTFVLLFLFTGSVIQPIRALLVNALSLAAAVGLVTWVFQDGHLIGIFGATARPMDASMTVLLLCITFGLSMDYEVFLSSRITELHAGGADLRTSVTSGLARTGRIVTSAALLLSVSFFAFTTSSVSMLQLFGLGAGMAVLIDATLIRGVLVPAVMRLLGRVNFWAPAPLARLHGIVGIREE